MKVYKVTFSFLPLNEDQVEYFISYVECSGYFAEVKEVQSAEIGEWTDEHPLNREHSLNQFESKNEYWEQLEFKPELWK